MPVPARPEKLLEATYGPGWRVPDPAFKFSDAAAHHPRLRRLVPRHPARASGTGSGATRVRGATAVARTPRRWPGGRREGRRGARRRRCSTSAPAAGPTACGWPAQGIPVTAYDYVPARRWRPRSRGRARRASTLEVRHLNLTEWRSVFGEGARLAHAAAARGSCSPGTSSTRRRPGRPGVVRAVVLDGAARRRHRWSREFHVGRRTSAGPRVDASAQSTPTACRYWLLDARPERHRIEVTSWRRKRPTVRLVGEW